MKIEFVGKMVKEVPFASIQRGETFEYCSMLYLKGDDNDGATVRLVDGSLGWFSEFDSVKPCLAQVTYSYLDKAQV